MKKLLSLLLALLMLPAAALCETVEAPEIPDIHDLLTFPLDFGDFVMMVDPNDALQSGQKADQQTWAILYPDYDPAANFNSSINVVWQSQNLNLTVNLLGADIYAAAVLQELPNQMAAMGITATNAQLIQADLTDDVLTFSYSIDLDYTPAGVDMQMTLWYTQQMHLKGDAGAYVFTVTADSESTMWSLNAYLDGITFAE